MRILQLSTFDTRFGAAIAARRLHEALLANGEECDFLVNEKEGNFPRSQAAYTGFAKTMARARHRLDIFPLKFYRIRSYSDFSPNWVASPLPGRVDDYNPDIVHMHWCLNNYVSTPTLPHMGRPLIWTFHDMWAFTGGCHYTNECQRYLTECGACPVLKSPRENDLSRRLWKQKRSVYARVRNSLQVVCPSNWMAGLARNAPLLEGIPVHVVPNPIDTRVFTPTDKSAARRTLGLPEQGPLLLMGTATSWDTRKGFDLLDAALQHYAAQPDSAELGLVFLGHKADALSAHSGKLRIHHLEFVSDESRLAAIYNAVDLVALPSREENLSNMLAEGLSCGTPCLAFGVGGNADLVSHQTNGYLAKPFDTADMAAGLSWILNNLRGGRRESIARATQAKLSYETLVPKFLEIYQAGLKKAATGNG
jgi:glycosyltransferase involved in cell wall biosynthesis